MKDLTKKDQQNLSILQGVVIASLLFSIILSAMLAANYIQMESLDPIDSPALHLLMKKLKETPGSDALKEEIRALDLLARKAYFTSKWQLRTGGYILCGALLVLFGALHLTGRYRKKVYAPGKEPQDIWNAKNRSRRWITISGSFLFMLGILGMLLAQTELARDDVFQKPVAAAATEEDFKNNWPNFRGYEGNAIAFTDKAPISWDGKSGKGVEWKVEVPLKGFSSPIIWGEKLFITGADKKLNKEVYCFSTEDGKLLWTYSVKGVPGEKLPEVHDDTGYAPSTMSTDGKLVFAIFPGGDLVALDMDGRKVWKENLGFPENHYGHSSSLINWKNLLIVQYDQNERARLIAFNSRTGKVVWEKKRKIISWSSPICVNTGKRTQIVLTDSKTVSSYDPQTGELLWERECMGGEMGPSAVFANGMIFAANEYAVTAGLKLNEKEDGTQDVSIAWEWSDTLPDTASPAATDDYLFLATSSALVVCLDTKTGKMLWEKEFDDGFYSSPIIAGNNVYVMDMQGIMHVFEADKEYKAVGDLKLGEPAVTTPAFVKDRIYLRGEKYLYCITGK